MIVCGQLVEVSGIRESDLFYQFLIPVLKILFQNFVLSLFLIYPGF